MPTPQQLKERFWKALKSDMTMMLGLDGVEDGHARPMTAQFEREQGPIWFFTSKDNAIVQKLPLGKRAIATFTSKDHDLFATLHGNVAMENSRAVLERLWNPYIAAWFEGGKDDPKLLLLRFEPDEAQVWLNENRLLTGVKLLLGRDPKQDYRERVADLHLGRH
jgi:general stress protein 26